LFVWCNQHVGTDAVRQRSTDGRQAEGTSSSLSGLQGLSVRLYLLCHCAWLRMFYFAFNDV